MPETERFTDVARAAAAPALMLTVWSIYLIGVDAWGLPNPPKAISVPLGTVALVALLPQVWRALRIAYVHGCYRAGRLARLLRL